MKGKLTLSKTDLQDVVDALRKGISDYETQCEDRYKHVFVGADVTDVRVYHNMTAFLVYMMDNTLIELEKEHLMELISYHCNGDLTSLDFQNLHYILSMKGQKTYIDFCNYYNRYNERRSMSDIFDIMLTPLLKKGVIIEGGATSKNKEFPTFSDGRNHTFSLNKDFFNPDDPKIKHLVLK